MSGTAVAEALLSGPITASRCKKAGRHLDTPAKWREFVTAVSEEIARQVAPFAFGSGATW